MQALFLKLNLDCTHAPQKRGMLVQDGYRCPKQVGIPDFNFATTQNPWKNRQIQKVHVHLELLNGRVSSPFGLILWTFCRVVGKSNHIYDSWVWFQIFSCKRKICIPQMMIKNKVVFQMTYELQANKLRIYSSIRVEQWPLIGSKPCKVKPDIQWSCC